MGRHSRSYLARQQGLRGETPHAVLVGRIGFLAVALSIGIGAFAGTATANADTDSSNAAADRTIQTSGEGTDAEAASVSGDENDLTEHQQDEDDDVETEDDDVETEDVDVESEEDVEPDSQPSRQRRGAQDDSPQFDSAAADLAPQAPAPDDQATTDYGDIGKWMLERNGDIADYGGLPYEGKTVLEPVNVIIVDQTSRSSLEAGWRLSAAMRRAGFPPRFFHSTGFRGLIDDVRYRQRPGGLLLGYSDDFFLLPNNHGRIFGPDPADTSSGYVWSGAFSTEEFTFYQGLPRHAYVSSNVARDALADDFVASGRATLGGMVALDNAYDTDTVTTGDHDGYAVVIILGGPGTAVEAVTLVDRSATEPGTCGPAQLSSTASTVAGCPAVALAIKPES